MEDTIEHVVKKNGVIKWIRNQLLHRLDGPAVINKDGRQEWFQNGRRHRLDGPAVINKDGRQEWFQNGHRHRLDGPAVIDPDGSQEWWINNKRVTQEIIQWMKKNDIVWPWDKETQMFFEFSNDFYIVSK